MFNAIEWLNDSGIPYSLSGKNISQGWIGISCPYCGDRSTHGGISPSGTSFSCFRCGRKGSIADLIKEIENCSKSNAIKILNKFSSVLYTPDYFTKSRASKVEWPPSDALDTPFEAQKQYIIDRGYDFDHIVNNYGIKFGGYTGQFKYRILIPVIFQGRVVSYIGRDIGGQAHLKYKNLREEDSVLPVKETVYNIDNISDEAIICEGVFDAWRFHYNAVALFGLVYTQTQIRILGNKLKRAVICFDNEPQAEEAADDLAEALNYQGVKTEILLIDTKDPGEMSAKEANEVIQELFS